MHRRISLTVAGLIFFTIVLLVAIVLILRMRGYEFVTLPPEKLIRTEDYVANISISPDGNIALTCPVFQMIELNNGVISHPKGINAEQVNVAISPDGNSFVTAQYKGELQLWDMKTKRSLKQLNVYDAQEVLFDRDGNHVFADDQNGVVERVDLRTGDIERVFGPESKITIPKNYEGNLTYRLLAISPDAKDLIIDSSEGTHVWSLQTLNERFSTPSCTSAAISNDGSLLAITNRDLDLWNFRTGQHVKKLVADKQGCVLYHVAFSSDDKFLVASMVEVAEFPSYIIVWRVGNYSNYIVFSGHTHAICAMCFIPGTHKLVTCAKDTYIVYLGFRQIELV